ncbi:MAG: hypothetical protein NTW56_02220 [Alphaproteobacteria bacterium]|nr:hypothetical protein [Alphaproteobacteria bacterium]
MNEAVLLDSTMGVAALRIHAEPRATLAGASLPDLCNAARLQWALARAGLHPTCADIDDEFVNEMCTADAIITQMIADRPAATLADIAAKAGLIQRRDLDNMTREELALLKSTLADVVTLAAREGAA